MGGNTCQRNTAREIDQIKMASSHPDVVVPQLEQLQSRQVRQVLDAAYPVADEVQPSQLRQSLQAFNLTKSVEGNVQLPEKHLVTIKGENKTVKKTVPFTHPSR